ncbi:hypothetical protein GEMRC1_013897 [Eukaryota sp. GEM-RC1]
MTEPLPNSHRLSNDTPPTTDVTLETVSNSFVSSFQRTEDKPDTIYDSLFLLKPSVHFQESFLVLINLHLVKRLIKSMLNKAISKYEYFWTCRKSNTHSYLDCLFDAFFKKVGYVSDRFLEFSISSVKVFLQLSTIPLNVQHLHSVSSINSFFGADVRSVSLNMKFENENDYDFQRDLILGVKLQQQKKESKL